MSFSVSTCLTDLGTAILVYKKINVVIQYSNPDYLV